jgi:epoxyqueuosine reductase QueG
MDPGLGNWLASVAEPPEAAVAALREAMGNEEPLVREHTAWALARTSQGGDKSERTMHRR